MFSHRSRLVLAFAIAIIGFHIFTVSAYAYNPDRLDPADLKNIMLVKDVKIGMKGHGKTVFQGTEPETFQVEVLGIMEKAIMGTELVLVRLTGGPMTSRGANLIEGMSGSPIFINGKILGAFAYGGMFGKEPIGMVTPIQYMLEAWDPSLPSKPSSFHPFSAMNLDQPIMLDGQLFGRVAIDGSLSGPQNYDPDTLVFSPLSVPITVSGASQRTISRLQDGLNQFNSRLVAGPGFSSEKAGIDVKLQPGSAVGVSLVTGDVDMTGIGTLTYLRDDKIIAFGHPMFGIGAMDAMLTSAYVFDVFPSYMVSSKIAGPLKPVGRISQDRPWCVAGELGKAPEMIPITVHVNNKSLHRNAEFNAQVINHPMLSAMLIPMIAAEGIFTSMGAPMESTAYVKMRVETEDLGVIERENTFVDSSSIEMASIRDLRQLMSLLRFNPFRPVSVKKVDLWVEIIPAANTARLERIFVGESRFEPGDTVEVRAVLRPFNGERVTKTINLELPRNTPNGTLTLQVHGGGVQVSSSMMSPDDEIDPGPMPGMLGMPQVQPTGDSLDHLIKRYLERNKNNELVARVVLPRSVPTIAGERLTGLPPSITTAMRATKSTMLRTEREEVKNVQPTDWVISGSQRLSITVQKADRQEQKTPGRPSPGSSGPGASSDGGASGDINESDGMSLTDNRLLNQYSDMPLSTSLSSVRPLSSDVEIESADEDESESGEDASSDKSDSSTAAAKPVGRSPATWRHSARTDFANGTMTNTTVTTGDLLMLAGSLKPLYESDETYVWSMLSDAEGNLYIGTGNSGIIYKLDADGNASTVYDSSEIGIHSLVMDSHGNLYAGTSPNGLVYKVKPDGDASVLLDAEEKHIVALAVDSKGNIYAAAGDKCKVYRIAPDGTADVVLSTSEFHALSLAVDSSDNLYVGTGMNGIIYKIAADGTVSVLYDAGEDSVTALAVDSDDVLYAGTSPKGVIYKLSPGAAPKTLYDKAGPGIMDIAVDESGNVFAVNSANVFMIMQDETVCTLGNDRDIQLLSLAQSNGTVYAGTGSIAAVYRAEVGKPTEGTYESPVHDCGLTSNWGVINWTAEAPNGSSVTLQTRTGNVAEPDSTWSDWSASYSRPGLRITSPPGRYIQYKASLKTDGELGSPKLKDLSIVYLGSNRAPEVTLTSPKGGERWSKKQTIRWRGVDPDKDTLTYDLLYSNDGGSTWLPLGEKITGTAQDNEAQGSQEETVEEEFEIADEIYFETMTEEQMLEQIAAELDKHPDIPQEIKDSIMADAPAMIAEELAAQEKMLAGSPPSPRPGGASSNANSTKQTSFSWDTAKYPDGSYLVKIVASDRLSNPTDALTGEAVSGSIIVSNKPPRVAVFAKSLTVEPDNSVSVNGVVYHDLLAIAGVQYRIGSNEWAAAAASDGIFDSSFETFVITTNPLDKGEHTIEVKAIDEAGNSATTKVKARVE